MAATRAKPHASWAAALATLLVAATWSPPSAQSLAEVARAEATRRAAVARSGPTLTNKDLKPAADTSVAPTRALDNEGAGGGDAAAPGGGPVPPTAEAAAAETPEDAPRAPAPEKRDETYWRTRFTATRGAVARAEEDATAVQGRVRRLDAELESGGSDARRAEVARDREAAVGALVQLQRRVINLREELAALEQLARTLDVPADWTR
jgi:hypothetical protein